MTRRGAIVYEDDSAYQDAWLKALKRSLWEWGRWTRINAMPNLDIPEPPCFQLWRPLGDRRDAGWGDAGPPEERPDSVDEQACQRTDDLIKRLPVVHRIIIIDHYAHRGHHHRDVLDAAVRAFGDFIARY